MPDNPSHPQLAYLDDLTGLYNRRYLTLTLPKELTKAKDKKSVLSIFMIDFDDFKSINDTHGHAVGDGVLKVVAKTIQDGVRSGDIAARWGGEEMIVALLGVNESGAKKKANQIRKSIERLSFNNLPDIQMTVSAGVSSFEAGNNFDEIINRADKALYQAKKGGRNRVVSWTELSPEITKV